MKKLLLLLLISGYVAKASQIQIEFISGSNIYVIATDPATPQIGVTTTDSGINTILASYGINQLLSTFSHDFHEVIIAEYGSADLTSLIDDLMQNSNVSGVRRCYESTTLSGYSYADQLYVFLTNNADGNPIGVNGNGNIVTSNAAINLIFDTYNVKSMNFYLASGYYVIIFDGNINGLKNELDAMTGIVNTYLVNVAILANPQFEKPKAIIAPNPFSDIFNIETEQTITNYSIIDISGKTIVSTSSKSGLDNQSSQLSAGMYILNLTFDNGQQANYKLIKK